MARKLGPASCTRPVVRRTPYGIPWRDFERWLLADEGGGYTVVMRLTEQTFAGVRPQKLHWIITTGQVGDEGGYDDRWCYETHDDAAKALAEWDGTGEPTGWFAHPMSGRVRRGGSLEMERIE